MKKETLWCIRERDHLSLLNSLRLEVITLITHLVLLSHGLKHVTANTFLQFWVCFWEKQLSLKKKKKNDLFSVISKEHVVSNEHNLLSFCWLFSFKNKEETYFPCFLYSLWHFKLLQTYFLLHIFLRKKCHKFALILLDLTCVEILHDAKPVLRITGTRGRNIKGESCKDAISAACVSLKYVYFPFSGPF